MTENLPSSGDVQEELVVLVSVQIEMYNSAMPLKKVPFTDAREGLAALIDEVQKSGRPIAITRRGKPAVVIMNVEVLEQKLGQAKQRPWMLRGSGTLEGLPAEIDRSIREIRQQVRTTSHARVAKLNEGLARK